VVISDRWGGFLCPIRNLTGVEKLCTLFYDDPAFLGEMMEANAEFIIAMMDGSGCDRDRRLPFGKTWRIKPDRWSRPGWRREMLPRYRKVVEFLRPG
jgi:hypothetical protein